MSGLSVGQMADRVSALLGDRLGLRGRDLAAKLQRGGKLLPRKIRIEAELLAAASEQARLPRFAARIDRARVEAAYEACTAHLKPIGVWRKRGQWALNLFTALVFVAVVTFGVVVTVMVRRGLL
jgi:hypothetical protein